MSGPESALLLTIRLNRWWWLWRVSAFGGLWIYLVFFARPVQPEAVLMMTLFLPLAVTASMHGFTTIVCHTTGIEILNFRKSFVAWRDIAGFKELESSLSELSFLEPSWVAVHLKPEADRSGNTRGVSLVSSRTYVTLPPMTLPADDLIALLESLQEKYGR